MNNTNLTKVALQNSLEKLSDPNTYNLVHGILFILKHYPNSKIYDSDINIIEIHIIKSNQDIKMSPETISLIEHLNWTRYYNSKLDVTIWYY